MSNMHFAFVSGVQKQIDYIKTLGVDSVWLSPFYQNGRDTCHDIDGSECTNNTQNYDWQDVVNHNAVAPIFGDEDDLDSLLQGLSDNGKYV